MSMGGALDMEFEQIVQFALGGAHSQALFQHYNFHFCCRLIEEDDTRRRQSERSLPLKQAIEVSLEDDPCITEHDMTSNTGLHIGMFCLLHASLNTT